VERRSSRRCMTSRVTVGPLEATKAMSDRASTAIMRGSIARPALAALTSACTLSDSSLRRGGAMTLGVG